MKKKKRQWRKVLLSAIVVLVLVVYLVRIYKRGYNAAPHRYRYEERRY